MRICRTLLPTDMTTSVLATHLDRQIGMAFVRSIVRIVCDAVSRGRRSYFHSRGLGAATPSTPPTPHTGMDTWNIRVNEVADYVLNLESLLRI